MGSDGLYQSPQLFASMPQSKSYLKSFRSSLSNNIVVKTSIVKTTNCSTKFLFVSANNTVVVDLVVNTTSCNSVSFPIWHSRLGHHSVDAMKTVFRLYNLPNINKNSSDFCNHCCIGKSNRLLSSSSLIVYEKPFDLIFTDLWGPAPFPSPLAFRYYVTFVDVNTIFITWFYLLKNKFDTFETFNLSKTMVSNQFNASIKVVQ